MTDSKPCLTPGAFWRFEFHPGELRLHVTYQNMEMGGLFGVDRNEALALESEIHDALEPIFAKRWTAQNFEYRALKDQQIAADRLAQEGKNCTS
jgi:hypothetical protein